MTTSIYPVRVDREPRERELHWFGVALLVLAAGLTANTVAGPLVTGWVTYPISESLLNQLIGLELVTIVLVVPVTLVSATLAVRSNAIAPVLAFGPAAYTAYMFVQYVVGPDYATYSVIVIVHVALTGLAGILTLWSWALGARTALSPSSVARRRRRAALLVGFAGFVVLRYLPGFIGAVGEQPIPPEFLDARPFFWSIFLLDLGVVVPGTALAALALWSAHRAGERAYFAVLGWFVMVPPSVAAMAAVMVLRADPNGSVPTLILLTVASGAFAVPLLVAVRGELRSGSWLSIPAERMSP